MPLAFFRFWIIFLELWYLLFIMLWFLKSFILFKPMSTSLKSSSNRRRLRLTKQLVIDCSPREFTVQCELTFYFQCSHHTAGCFSQLRKRQPQTFTCCLHCQMLGLSTRSSFAKLHLWWVLWHWSKLKIGAFGSVGLFLCFYLVGEESRRAGNEDEFYADIVRVTGGPPKDWKESLTQTGKSKNPDE